MRALCCMHAAAGGYCCFCSMFSCMPRQPVFCSTSRSFVKAWGVGPMVALSAKSFHIIDVVLLLLLLLMIYS